ncbi:S1 family peptidase [Aquabacterium sp. OR-4]|uniref:S1 family peptidase n=1 Tax=Aquabacterium sp. OR-4 TaxID=2978127 RepID=UPI0021B2F308|nr:serine protease [Aquabacterium sp. OR-4]MDT7835688.1 serine protease [Aquabacterium sp. OR-4]
MPCSSRRLLLSLGPAALLALLSLSAPARADLPATTAVIKRSVVAVGAYDPLANPRFSFRGTGFVVDDGQLLITNAHVLPELTGDQKLAIQVGRVRLESGGQFDVRTLTLLAIDREHDLALLRFSGAPLPAVVLAETEAVREGQAIGLMGFPIGGVLGFSPVTHRGIVASITPIVLPPANARQLDAAAVARVRRGAFDILQLDATAYPGNSGGPVFDADTGQVHGVVNMVFVKGSRESALTNPTGITYAIPVRWVHALLAAKR